MSYLILLARFVILIFYSISIIDIRLENLLSILVKSSTYRSSLAFFVESSKLVGIKLHILS